MIISQVLINDCEVFPGCLFHVYTLNINQTIQILNRDDLNSFRFENEETNTKITFMNTRKNLNRTTINHEEKNNSKIRFQIYIFQLKLFELDSTWYAVSITNLRTAHLYIPNLRLGR